jgi:pimeloyl-ACP methyl ester carboxylesterase
MTNLRNAIGLCAVVCVAVSSPALLTAQLAQRNPVLFAHGIRSDSSTWSVTAPALENAWPIRAVRKTTPWTASPITQAATLSGVLGSLPDTTIAIAHSMGGIVLREAAKQPVPYRAMVTVGSLHSGAPAAYSVLIGSMSEIGSPLVAGYAALCIIYCGEEAPGIPLDIPFAVNAVQFVNLFLQSAVDNLDFDPGYELWNYMYPSSPYMQSINSPSVLASVASHVPIRAAIRTRLLDPKQAMWRLAANEQVASIAMTFRDAAVYQHIMQGISAQQEYCDGETFDYTKCINTWRWFYQATLLANIDGAYCARMQNEGALGNAYDTCDDSDDVVPFQRQLWGPSGYSSDIVVVGPSHVEQTKDPVVRARFADFFASTGLAPCGQGPAFRTSAVGNPAISAGEVRVLALYPVDRCDWVTSAGSQTPVVSSQNPGVVSVAAVGPNSVTLIGQSPGSTLLNVTFSGASSTVAVSVPPGSFASLSLSASPSGPYLPGDAIEFHATPYSGSPVVAYEWRVNGGAVVSTSPDYTHWFVGDAVIVATITTASGETASANAYLNSGGVSLRAASPSSRPIRGSR